MRFEIGPAGGFVILVGLLGLSATVFFSWNDLRAGDGAKRAGPTPARERLSSARLAPQPLRRRRLPSPSHRAPLWPPPNRLRGALPSGGTAQAPPHTAMASVPARRSAPAAEESDSSASPDSSGSPNETDTDTDEGAATAPPPSASTHHHGYNILIDAAMDHAAAVRMTSRLIGLGYTSHVIPSQVNGQTWYRVQVGPYPTSAAAQAAQAQLRAAYAARYVNHTERQIWPGPQARPQRGAGERTVRQTPTRATMARPIRIRMAAAAEIPCRRRRRIDKRRGGWLTGVGEKMMTLKLKVGSRRWWHTIAVACAPGS